MRKNKGLKKPGHCTEALERLSVIEMLLYSPGWALVLAGFGTSPVILIEAVLAGDFQLQLFFGCILMELLYFPASYFFYRMMKHTCRRYSILPEGLVVKFPFRKAYLIPWDACQQVCICREAWGGSSPPVDCIAFIKKGEKLNGYMRWNTDNIFHERGVFTVPYIPQFLDQVSAYCPLEVVDLRDTMPYRIDLYKKK